MRLYQPDDVLAARLPNGIGEVATYSKSLVRAGAEFFNEHGSDFGSLGVLVAVGIEPTLRTKLWCEMVGGTLPQAVWDRFVDFLEGAGVNVRTSVTAPVAYALECSLGEGPSVDFPEGPSEWLRLAVERGGSLAIPDELFSLAFAD